MNMRFTGNVAEGHFQRLSSTLHSALALAFSWLGSSGWQGDAPGPTDGAMAPFPATFLLSSQPWRSLLSQIPAWAQTGKGRPGLGREKP